MLIRGSDAARFICGRRRYNRLRGDLADQRRRKLVELMRSIDISRRGWRSALARELDVHPATISRDVQALGRAYRQHTIETDEAWQRADRSRADDQSRLQISFAAQLKRSTGCQHPLVEILLGDRS